MSTIELRIKPQGPVLDAYYRDRSRVSMIMGPLGSGKTIQTCLKIVKLMCDQPANPQGVRPSRWYAVRNTYPDLLTTTVKDWLEIAGDLGHYTQGSKEPPNQKLRFRLEDGTTVQSELIFLAMDREDHVKKLRGAQVTGFWLNEAKEIPKSVLDMADLRHGRYPTNAAGGVKCGWHGILGDTNAPDDDHWYYRLAEEDKPEGWTFHRQPGGLNWDSEHERWVPNPDAENTKNLPDGYYDAGCRGKTHEWVKTNLANEYGSVFDGKPVYSDYNDRLHCRPAAGDSGLPLLLGWDFGLTPSCIICQLTPNGRLIILSELTSDGMGIKQFGRNVVRPHLVNQYQGYTIGLSVGDPAGAQGSQTDKSTCFEALNLPFTDGGVGIPTYPAPSNSPVARIGAVEHFLTTLRDGEPGLHLSPECKVLRKGFLGGYRYKRVQVTGDERYQDKPDKNQFSHPHDALQYIALAAISGMTDQSDDDDDYFDDHPKGRSAVGGY